MTKKDVLRKWNGYFKRSLAKGNTWNQIRHSLASKGYKTFSIEWLIQRYRKQQLTQHRIVTIFLALTFALMLVTPFILKMTGITGFAIGVPTTYYVDATNGNDANDGLTPETAIKTITKVNALRLYPGDSVLFKCGETWRFTDMGWLVLKYSGDDSGHITYSSFGDCDDNNKPLFLGSYDLSSTDGWESNGNNIWSVKRNISEDIGNLIFNDETLGGNKKPDLNSLVSQGDFYYDGVQDKLFLHSVTNPGTYYSHIEASTWAKYERDMFDFYNRHHLNFTGLSLKYGFTGFGCFECNNIIIKNNEIGFMGAPYQSGTLRYGDGIDIAMNSNNIYIGYNKITDCWDSCIGSQSWSSAGTRTITNHVIEYNIAKNCAFGYGHFNSNITSNTRNITVRHNTIINSGYGIFCPSGDCYAENRREGGRGMRLDRSPPNTTQFVVIDNIIYDSSFRTVDIAADRDWYGELTLDYNIHYEGGRYFLLYNGTNYRSLIELTLNTGLEEHGLEIDPNFIEGTFTPQPESPACSMSSTGSYVGALPCESEPEPPASFCGDAVCDANETCSDCEVDCGACPPPEPYCGDGTCDEDENCSTCEPDCGVCPEEQQPTPICGDEACNGDEDCSSCEVDCGECPILYYCGDSVCDANESCDTCESDCGICHVVPSCGDESCNGLENCSSCEVDCGVCPVPASFCGDAVCDANETCADCESDCGLCPLPEPFCGDGECNGEENCSTCESDCGVCPLPEPFCGDLNCDVDENCSTCEDDCGECPEAETTNKKSSGGGGGGGSISTAELESDWVCDDWSECIDGKQTQTCEHRIKSTTKTNTRKCDSILIETESSKPAEEEKKESVIVPKKEGIEEEQPVETSLQEPGKQLPGRVINPGVRTDYPFIVGLLSMIIVLVFMVSTHRTVSRKGTQITMITQEAEPDYRQELEDYYGKATKAGYTTEEIKNELLKVGWESELIETFIKGHFQENNLEKEAAVADDEANNPYLGLNEPSETVSEILLRQHMSIIDNQMKNSLPLDNMENKIEGVGENEENSIISGDSASSNNI